MGWSDELASSAPATPRASWADELAGSVNPGVRIPPTTPQHAAVAARVAADQISQDAQSGPSIFGEFARSARDYLAGGARGAGSIGATLAYPVDKAQDLYYGDRNPSLSGLVTGQQPISRNQERRQAMDWALGDMGADTNSPAYAAGKLTTEVAGTAGAGGAVANGLRALPEVVSAARPVAALADSIGSGGFSVGNGTGSAVGNLAVRGAGGAINGGVSAGIVDPSTAATGAAIGAALPAGAQAVGKVLQGAGSLASSGLSHSIGASTGAGADALKTAFQAGKDGSKSFIENLRGNVPMADVVDQARAGISNLRATRAAAYKAGMGNVAADTTVLDIQPVKNAVDGIASTGYYKGQQINGSAAGTLDAITNKVNAWQALDPKEFHTAEGFDALKQAIGDIRDSTDFGTPARRAADTAYNAVKAQITKQAPEYAKTMQGYAEASDQINEITKALSLGEKASADTSLRKLQSLMRNNAQTNYGNRLSLAQALQEHGNSDIMPALAGQALNSWTPRGMVGALEKGGGVLGAVAHPASIPMLAGAAPFMSPRIMGEAAYGAGRLSGKLNPKSLGQALMQGTGSSPQDLLSANPTQEAWVRALMNSSVLATSGGQ